MNKELIEKRDVRHYDSRNQAKIQAAFDALKIESALSLTPHCRNYLNTSHTQKKKA